MFNIQEFQAAFLPLYCTVSKCISMGKLGSVYIRCVPTLHRMHVESRVFNPTISKRSCHLQHSTC